MRIKKTINPDTGKLGWSLWKDGRVIFFDGGKSYNESFIRKRNKIINGNKDKNLAIINSKGRGKGRIKKTNKK